jgi:hypothetical protein
MPNEIDERTELAFVCPHCEGSIAHLLDRDEVWIACPHCAESISLAAQQAMSRAYDNYTYARELTTRELLGGRKSMRRLNQLSPGAKDALRIYQKAYTGIQQALQAPIPEPLRALAVEMMAEIVRILQRYHMVTGLEAEYWTELMVWQTAREEYAALDDRLTGDAANLLVRLFRYPHWRLRRFQLKRALAGRRERLRALKQELNLVNTFYV